MKVTIRKSSHMKGETLIPPSKSHTIRAILLSAFSQGTSEVYNPGRSLDCMSAVHVARQLGAEVQEFDDHYTIKGVGGNMKMPTAVLDAENSATLLYFTTPVMATMDGCCVFTGDWTLCKRPIQDMLNAMNTLGAKAYRTRSDVDGCPVVIHGKMHGGTTRLQGNLCQHVSGMMLAAPLLEGDTTILSEHPLETPYLTMTIDWMRKHGVEVDYDKEEFKWYKIKGGQTYQAAIDNVPGDWSGGSFMLVLGAMCGDEIIVNNLDYHDGHGDAAVLDVLQRMGADIEVDDANKRVIIRGGKELHGTEVDMSSIPDSLPAMVTACAFAKTDSKLTNIANIRFKESDRVGCMQEEMAKFGVEVIVNDEENYMIVKGGTKATSTVINSHGDHRIAMAMALQALQSEGEAVIEDAEVADVSYPGFFQTLAQLGADITIEE